MRKRIKATEERQQEIRFIVKTLFENLDEMEGKMADEQTTKRLFNLTKKKPIFHPLMLRQTCLNIFTNVRATNKQTNFCF